MIQILKNNVIKKKNPNSGLSDGKKPLTKKEKEYVRGVRSHNVDWSPCGYEPENAARLCGVYIVQAPTGKTYVGMSDKNCLNETLLRTLDAISRGEIQNKRRNHGRKLLVSVRNT